MLNVRETCAGRGIPRGYSVTAKYPLTLSGFRPRM